MSTPPWQLVIFDNDGVVVDSEPLASLAISQVLSESGVQMTPDECDEAFRGSTLARTRELVESATGRELPDGFEELYTARLFELFRRHLRPVRGIEAVLDRLDEAGLAYCLASSGQRHRIRFALEMAGLDARFEGRFWGAEDVSVGKPAPDLFLLAARQMGVSPDRCVVVEDAEVGVMAAKAAGMAALGFVAGGSATGLAAADAVFTDMTQLPALLLDGLGAEPGSA